MGIFNKIFKKRDKKEDNKDSFKLKELTQEEIQELEKQYKNNPHFIAICQYNKCYHPMYKSDKYKTINNNGKNIKIHVTCLRKMKKEALKLMNSGLVPRQ